MLDYDDSLRAFFGHCTYPQLLGELRVRNEDLASAVPYLAQCDPPTAAAIRGATVRLDDELAADGEDDERIFLTFLREYCDAHLAFSRLTTGRDRSNVDPRRLYAYADDDLFAMADYADTLHLTAINDPGFRSLEARSYGDIAPTVASILAALTARSYDPPPICDKRATRLFGELVMTHVLDAEDAVGMIHRIGQLPPHAARCAAPLFANSYHAGHDRYDEASATTILTAVMAAAEDHADSQHQDAEERP